MDVSKTGDRFVLSRKVAEQYGVMCHKRNRGTQSFLTENDLAYTFDSEKEFRRNNFVKKHNNRKERAKAQIDGLCKKEKQIRADLAHLRIKYGNANPRILEKKVEELQTIKKEKQKIIATAHSGLTSGCKLLENLSYMIEYFKTLRSDIGEDTIIFFVDIFTTLFNIYHNPTKSSLMVNLSAMLIKYFPQEYLQRIISWISAIFEAMMKPDVTSQAGKADEYCKAIKGFLSSADSFLTDRVWTNIKDFFLQISVLYLSLKEGLSFEAFDIATITKNMDIVMTVPKKLEELVDYAFATFEFVMGNWDKIVSGNWSIFMIGKDQAQEFEKEVRVLEQAFDFAIDDKEIALRTHYNMTLKQFRSRLDKAVKTAFSLSQRCTSVQQKLAISNFIKTLTAKQQAFYAKMTDVPSREQPYAVKIAGPSACGKSFITDLLSRVILQSYGHDPHEMGGCVSANIAERYESTVTPAHKVIICDDVANRAGEKINYDRLLNYVNTVPRPLEKAGVEEKGRIYPNNDALIVTTNVADLKAAENSNCAESILRRFGLHIDVLVREKYRNEYGGVVHLDDTQYDLYQLTLNRFIMMNGKIPVFEPISRDIWCEGKSSEEGLDLKYLLRFLAEDIKHHRVRQQKKAASNAAMMQTKFCTKCCTPEQLCLCVKAVDSKEVNSKEVDSKEIDSKEVDAKEINSEEVTAHVGGCFSHLSTDVLWQYYSYVIFNPESLKKLFVDTNVKWELFKNRHYFLRLFSIAIGCIILSGFMTSTQFYSCLCFLLSLGCYQYYSLKRNIEIELDRRLDQFSSTCYDVKEHLKKNALLYCSCAVSFYTTYKLYQSWRAMQTLKETTEDKSTVFNEFRNIFNYLINFPDQSRRKIYADDERDYKEGYSRLPPKVTNKSKTTTANDLEELIRKSSRICMLKAKSHCVSTVNGILIRGNILLVPSHFIPKSSYFDIETSPQPGVVSSFTKDQKLSEKHVYRDDDNDFCLVHLPSCPPGRDLVDYFAMEKATFRGKHTRMLYKSPDGDIFRSEQNLAPYTDPFTGRNEIVYTGPREIETWFGPKSRNHTYVCKGALTTKLEFNSFAGLCGSLYFDNERAIIYGFHIAGISSGSTTGWCNNLTKPELEKGIKHVMEHSHCMILHSMGDVHVDTYGTDYTIENGMPLCMRDDGLGSKSIATYIGKVKKSGQDLVSAARTPYIPTPFKGIEVLGERKHRPPKNPNDTDKTMKTLNKLLDPVQHYEHDILEMAVNDFEKQTCDTISNNFEKVSSVLRIYSQEEAMDGTQDGNLFGLPNSTSAGFPIGKSKKKCLVRDPFDESVVKVPREFNGEYDIQKEIDRTLQCWRSGERSEPIYKASSKVNELLPTAKALTKVRKFYGSPFANFVASRRVLAGIPEFMRHFQEDTECFVGINATSEHWKKLHGFITTFSSDRMIAGDFAGFDTRMAAQITTAAAKIMVSWYRKVGLSEEDLLLVRGALSDICNPNILIDGDLYRFANGNPSGNLITVQLNSICNSIMMRYVYYRLNPKVKQSFNNNVKLATYGDDNAMGVKRSCGWFTHTACAKEFEKVGIEYTMADKSTKSIPYIGIDKITFLKRNFVTHETLNTIVAPIEIDSILKKFYWIKKSTDCPLSNAEQFGAYTDGSFREMYLHGRKVYDQFTENIKSIVDANEELKHEVNFMTFDEMTIVLKPDYVEGSQLNCPRKIFIESLGIYGLDEFPESGSTIGC